ncbi:MAG: acetate--CoA ligase family protein [Candidatus Aenigmatarchaeota archaeon]
MKIPDHAAYKMLESYGIPVANWSFVRTLEDAVIAAENLHFPLVLKIDSPEVMHKMVSGCIRTAHDMDHLRKMFEIVMKNARKQTKNINGIILQELIHSDLENVQEFIIGAKRDEQFGLVIMFGAGGRLTKVNDVCFRLVPITEKDALEMLNEPEVSKLVTRHDKIADILLKVSKLAEYEKISELDINPLLVSDRGVLAADVRILID